jgi:hypothetical protein
MKYAKLENTYYTRAYLSVLFNSNMGINKSSILRCIFFPCYISIKKNCRYQKHEGLPNTLPLNFHWFDSNTFERTI